MQTVADRPEAPTAIRTDLGAIFVSLELSRSTWLITSLSPGGGEKMSKQVVRGGDVAGLLERFAPIFARKRGRGRLRSSRSSSFRRLASTDFGIDRALQNEGIESHVVDQTLIATSRRRRLRRLTGSTAKCWFARCWRTSGVNLGSCDDQGTDSRGRGPPPPLLRAQGADRRAGPARQSRQGAAVLHRGYLATSRCAATGDDRLDTLQTGDGRRCRFT